MNIRSLAIWIVGCLGMQTWAQVTPPIQPKTVDTPKLASLTPPPLPPGVQSIANAPLTAAEAVQIALSHQPQVSISKAAADALHGQTLQALSALGPTVVAGATAEKTISQTTKSSGVFVPDFTQMTASASLSQLIYDFDKTREIAKQARFTELAGYRTYDQTLQDVALQTKQDFYAFMQAKQQTAVQNANLKSRQAQVDLTQAQVNAGTGEPADLVNAKTLAAQATLALLQAQQAQVAARVKLAFDMGIDPRTPIVTADSSETDVPLPSNLNSLVDLALKQRPVLVAAIESLRAAGYGVSVARKNNVPVISADAGVETAGANDFTDTQDEHIEVTLSWTLFDSGLTHGKIVSAKAEQASAQASLRQTTNMVMSDVSNAVVAVQSARQQVPIANAEVTDGQEGVRIATGQYRAGVATFQAIITAQAALVQAQTDQVNAVAALQTALTTLEHSIGKWPL